MLVGWITALASVLLFAAGLEAFYFLRVTGRRRMWLPVVVATPLAGLHLGLTALRLVEGQVVQGADYAGESAALLAGLFALVSITVVGREFRTLQRSWKRLEGSREQLHLSTDRLQTIFDNAPDAYFMYDEEGRLTDGNHAALQLVGYDRAELQGRSVMDVSILEPEDLERAAETLDLNLRGEPAGLREYRLRRKDGTIVPVEVHSFPVMIEGKRHVLVAARDLSERKRAEGLETSLGRMLEASPTEIYVFDAENLRFLQVNRGARNNLGYSLEELSGMTPLDLKPEFTEAQFRSTLEPLARAEVPIIQFHAVHHRKDGTLYPIEVHLHRTMMGETSVYQAFVLDISKRTQAYEQLRRSEARLLEAQRVAHLGHWEWIIAPNILEWSPETYRIVGLEQDDFDGSLERWLACVHPDDRELVLQQASDLVEYRSHANFDHRVVRPDGEVRYLQEDGEVVRDETDGSLRVIGTVFDITERKRAEQALEQLNRNLESRVQERTGEMEAAMKELESFSYAVSHDLRQPLRTLDGFVRIIEEDDGPNISKEGRGMLRRVIATADRMSGMIDSLLSLARTTRAELQRETVDLSKMARQIAAELHQTDPARQVRFEIEPNITADADATLVRVLLGNLLGNAWKFTAGGEEACIEFGLSDDHEDAVYVVRDNGVGFDMDHAGKLFGAFQRLHRDDEFDGTGIGLATAERIVGRHGGRIWGEGVSNEGAVFCFTLRPAVPAKLHASN